jgi:hypothetical protein
MYILFKYIHLSIQDKRIRWFSTDRQNESSIANPVRVCIECADSHGLQVMERFEDQGISGAALGNRPTSTLCWLQTCYVCRAHRAIYRS